LSNFQEELHQEGYENVVIIAVGQSNISSFNSNFCANSDLPLVMDPYPSLPVREQFEGEHKSIVIVDYDGSEIGRISTNQGFNTSVENYIKAIIENSYILPQLLGDINNDEIVNILDVIQTVNMVLGSLLVDYIADINQDGFVNIVDIITIVNIIISS
tara:strand:- start:29 stop:502 length:474 start_codon:yes stop_codon:yes gene_type:complete